MLVIEIRDLPLAYELTILEKYPYFCAFIILGLRLKYEQSKKHNLGLYISAELSSYPWLKM